VVGKAGALRGFAEVNFVVFGVPLHHHDFLVCSDVYFPTSAARVRLLCVELNHLVHASREYPAIVVHGNSSVSEGRIQLVDATHY
jgi:hypothetical protein